MKTSILKAFDSIPYFSIEAVRQLADDKKLADGSIQTALYRWMKTGQVIQLKRGIYMTRRFYELHRSELNFSAAISAILMPLSYTSLDFVLQQYDILTEITYPITAITLKNTRHIKNRFGIYDYHHIKKELYTGFTFLEFMGIPFAQATLSKALFDYVYLKTIDHISSTVNIMEELRLNIEDFKESDQIEFAHYVELSKSKKMDHILKNITRNVWQL